MNEAEESREKRSQAHVRALAALAEFREALSGLGDDYEADETRKALLYQLGFCESCGVDVMDTNGERRICHCTNDE